MVRIGPFIHHAVAPAYNLLNHILQLFRGGKAFAVSLDSAVPFHEDMLITVYHNFGNSRIFQQLLQDIEPPHTVEQLSAQLRLLCHRKIPCFFFP